jgi:hypothetical protein
VIDAWRALRPGSRALVGALVVILGLNLLSAGVTTVTGGSGPGGPPSSSYATADDGLAAYAELLARHGHSVERLRVSLDRADLEPGATVVVADPRSGLTGDEASALAAFVRGGGRLVAAGAGAADLLEALPGGGPEWAAAGVRSAGPLVPAPEVAGVATVETAGEGSWSSAGATLPVLGGPAGVLATVADVGAGRVVAIADASPLQNRLLDRADNAAFALAVAGAGRPIAFAEAQHGYGRRTGIGALPSRWRWALAGGFLAALVWMWSRGRRLGPADDVERTGAPPRRAYVDALAAGLARTHQPDVAMAPLQERARRRLAARAGLVSDAGERELREAAARLSLAPAEVEALFRPCHSDDDIVAVGRVMARLGEHRS